MMVADLILVNADANRNMRYRMCQTDSSTIRTEYGRIGATPMVAEYPIRMWDKLYNSHIKKGFVDRTELLRTKTVTRSDYRPIEDSEVRKLWEMISGAAKSAVNESYRVTVDEVTPEQIRAAQELIIKMSECRDEQETFNKSLIKLRTVIPQKMKNVKDGLACSAKDAAKIVSEEQERLDVLKSQINFSNDADEHLNKETILEHLELQISLGSSEDQGFWKKRLGRSGRTFVKVFHAENMKTKERQKRYMLKEGMTSSDEHLLFHGSRLSNIYGLMTTGPKLAPEGVVITGKMFGQGIYLADKACKSLGYLDGGHWARSSGRTGCLLVYSAAYKNPLDLFDKDMRRSMYSWTNRTISPHDILHAHAGRTLMFDEYCCFREEALDLRYVILCDMTKPYR